MGTAARGERTLKQGRNEFRTVILPRDDGKSEIQSN